MKSSRKKPDITTTTVQALSSSRSEDRQVIASASPPTIRAIFAEGDLEKVKGYSTRLPPRRRSARTLPPPPPPTDQQKAERASARELHRVLKDLGATLRLRREHLGLSLEAVTERCGINRAALSKLELGQNPNPTFETVWRYAAALGEQLQCELAASPGPKYAAQVAPGIRPGDPEESSHPCGGGKGGIEEVSRTDIDKL
jgi:transcriptional regulator with XRE-family HTH domain